MFRRRPATIAQRPGVNIGQPGAPAETGPPSGRGTPGLCSAKVVFRDTELVWSDIFAKMGRRYESPTLVLFKGRVESACGLANAAVGPFYCGGDSKVYIDLGFYGDMQRKLHAPGEFAGPMCSHTKSAITCSGCEALPTWRTAARLRPWRQKPGFGAIGAASRFLASVSAHHAQEKFDYLDPGDVESALNAANQIGDDRLQKQAQGDVVPNRLRTALRSNGSDGSAVASRTATSVRRPCCRNAVRRAVGSRASSHRAIPSSRQHAMRHTP